MKNEEGGERMEKVNEKSDIAPSSKKKEFDWAKYLDYTRFYEPGEINNIAQERFKKDFEEIK
ncbi:MAG: hypothetical protein ACFFB0_07655 [Promethearchaeota archaeon]